MQLIRLVTWCFRQQSGHALVADQCQRPKRLLVARRQAYASRVGDRSHCLGQSDSNICRADSTPVRGVPRVSYVCPACCQRIHRLSILQRHLQKCCPDLVSSQAWKTTHDDRQAVALLLDTAAEAELALRQTLIDTAFKQLDDNGNQIRLTTEEVAVVMNLPVQRVKQAFRMAQKAMPLVGDLEPVEVIHEDADVIAVNKPPYVISAPKHRYMGGSMVNRLITYLGYPPNPVHRLDMMTSGVLLMAKHHASASSLGQQFGHRTVKKAYLAIVTGSPNKEQFSVSTPIGRHPTEQIARAAMWGGDAAHTDFTVVASNPDADLGQYSPGLVATEQMYKPRGAALVIARPLTGRTHQIRVHLASAGHGIIGDEVYGIQGTWTGRQALHAASLLVEHPTTKEPFQLTAALPIDMASALRALNIACPTPDNLHELLSHATFSKH